MRRSRIGSRRNEAVANSVRALGAAAVCGHSARLGGICYLVFLGAVVTFGTIATADRGSHTVVLPGQEELIADIVGSGVTLPGGCQFTGGNIDDTVRAHYACDTGPVTIQLSHRGTASSAVAETTYFRIRVIEGSPPPDLVEALVARTRAREENVRWTTVTSRRPAWLITSIVAIMLLPPVMAVIRWLMLDVRWARSDGRPAVDIVALRIGGVVAITGVIVFDALSRGGSVNENAIVSVGIFMLVAFLWLGASGLFGYGDADIDDWIGLVPFGIALLVREFLTLHSVEQIDIEFAQGPVGRHSIVYPLLQLFFAPLVSDPHAFTMHLNGVFGSLAVLSAYLFVRERTGSRGAGLVCGLLLATHPVLARFSPTDGPYALLLFAWFWGLALLSASPLTERGLWAGTALLGIAATTRIEGVVLVIASVALVGRRHVLAAVRRAPDIALCALLTVAALITVQMYFLLPFYLGGPGGLPAQMSTLTQILEDTTSPLYDDHLLWWLTWIGVAAGIMSRRFRIGVSVMLAVPVMLLPALHAGEWIVALHRMVPTCAMRTIAAGIGAYALLGWARFPNRWGWVVAAPGTVVAAFVLATHHADLSKPYVFNTEYDLVRRHLGPAGGVPNDCALMTFSSLIHMDLDLKSFEQVVPDRTVIDCGRADCVSQLRDGRCYYYVRSAASYFHENGIPPACAAADANGTAADTDACLNPPTIAFEESVQLDVVERRPIDLDRTFPDGGFPARGYPRNAAAGLFRVRAKDGH